MAWEKLMRAWTRRMCGRGRYEVCNRMIELLETLQSEPMYELDAINPALSKNVRAVRAAKVTRNC